MEKPDFLRGKRILLVDDDDAFLSALKSSLERVGCIVISTSCARAAQRILDIESLDVLVSDIHMPNIDGIELSRFAKKTRPLPVILTTGFSEIEVRERAHSLGADGLITKPFRRGELIETLRKLL